MANNSIRIPFPSKGKDANWAASGQPPLTSPDLQNVRPRDVQDKRSRGGQRPAVRKVMYWWDYLGGGSDLGLPDPSPIIGMDQVTAVYYASIAGGDSGAGDPSQTALVFLVNNWQHNEIQIYDYAGNSVATGDIDDVAILLPIGLVIDSDGDIWTNPGGAILEIGLDGTILTTGANTGSVGAMTSSIKGDGLIFHGHGGDSLSARLASDGTTLVWSNATIGSATHSIYQLETSQDFYIGKTSAGGSVKRIDRTDGSIIHSRGKTGIGARSLAVDEVNGWIYHGWSNQIARVNISDNGDEKSLIIDGITELNKIILYNGKVYICGNRATDNNTVWRLDIDLDAIEVDYDTGDTANDMLLVGDKLYVVGVKGTTEDAEDGNVNILDSDLVKTESPWNLGPDKEILAIAEKV